MITREEVIESIEKSIATLLEVEKVELDENKAFVDLGLDSLDVFGIAVDLEKEYNIHLDEYNPLSTIRDLVDNVISQAGKCSTPSCASALPLYTQI